ncbi:GNAT family N-acetyltransferase [Kitasatospora sp. NBC_01287]|uniref:GNAT family N-acetyltransferase n=1 Tax=Kitasatospora sp. NBC_01287 TaxID=2903573 RepID=UPI002B1DCF94|nr:GNAT family N-acetyltransferase [Kitasatospora sp. NBC_01287]
MVALEAAAYTECALSEERAALESRARVSPATCFVLEHGGRLVGYLLALPYPLFSYPDLARAEQVAFTSRNLHLHDLVVAEEFRGRGLATRLLRRLGARADAAGYERISLIAVGGSDSFWSRQGFAPRAEVALPAGYGPAALYMSRALPAHPTRQPHPTDDPLPGSPEFDEVG